MGPRRLPRRLKIVLIAIVAAVLVIGGFQLASLALSKGSGFRVAVAGDFGSWSGFQASMQQLSKTGATFALALGDLSYGGESEADWCREFKSHFDQVQIIAGNHDTGAPPIGEGNINRYAIYCPYTLQERLTGVYAKQYYFDYPHGAPIARFILISPDVNFTVDGGELYKYNVGTARYEWTRDAIDGARSAGIPWVIVGMHKNCIAAGEHACEVGTDIMNLLLERKVDLILQAHTHHYERSKQLAVSPSMCAGIRYHHYTAECIVDDGADGQYAQGGGSVIVTAGTGGRDIDPFNVTDPYAGYVATWDADNVSGLGKGVVAIDLDANRISARTHFDGDFADAFTIVGHGRPANAQYILELFMMGGSIAAGAVIVLVWRLRNR